MADNDLILANIANDNIDSALAERYRNTDVITNKLKLFILAQAERDLNTILKLLRFLDKVEEAYENKVDQEMTRGTLTIYDYMSIISSINSSLSRCHTTINQVLKDDSLKNIFIVDNSTNINTDLNQISPGLSDPASRERVMKAVNSVLHTIDEAKSTFDYDTLKDQDESDDE